MRLAAALLASALVSCLACTKPLIVEKAVWDRVFDFTAYTSQGFLITPEKYGGDYEAIGLVDVTIRPSAREEYELDIGMILAQTAADPREALELLHKRASAMGADAIMNLTTTEVKFPAGKYIITGLRIDGFAIRRKGAFK